MAFKASNPLLLAHDADKRTVDKELIQDQGLLTNFMGGDPRCFRHALSPSFPRRAPIRLLHGWQRKTPLMNSLSKSSSGSSIILISLIQAEEVCPPF
jgi:hypothetical protein